MDVLKKIETPGAVTGTMLFAFVVGIAFHSCLLGAHVASATWLAILVEELFLLLVVPAKRLRILLLILAACLFGVWRFDVAPTPKLRWINGIPSEIRIDAEGEPFTTLKTWRVAVTERIGSAIPPDEATLVAGMLYGDEDLSKSQKAAFRTAGLMHLVAVSGSNVTIVIAFVVLIAHALHLRRRHAFVANSLALLGFVCFVGLSASVLRAACMGWLLLLARELGYLSRSRRLLLCAAVILLLIDPWQLAFDAGFALSFLAMIGLLFWTPIFERGLWFVPKRLGLRSILSATCGATLMTVPYSAWVFQQLTLAGLFTNILALPLVPFVMLWGAVAAVWGSFVYAQIVAAPAYGLALTIEKIADLAYATPWLEATHVQMVFPLCAATYLLIGTLWWKLKDGKKLSTSRDERAHISVSFDPTVSVGQQRIE